MMKIVCPIPNFDFDPTEVGVPWQKLTQAGHEIIFATPDGKPAVADFRMATGKGLGLLKSFLMADKEALLAYHQCIESKEFLNPIPYTQISSANFGALFLPGGHAKGMRKYLESNILQNIVTEFFMANKPVAAICHGTLLAARSIDPRTKKSVLYGRKTTGLTFWQEWMAWMLTRTWLGDYYRTYEKFMEKELTSFLKDKKDFDPGPLPLFRDQSSNLKHGFTVRDENYLSARWPGDAHTFANEFVKLLS